MEVISRIFKIPKQSFFLFGPRGSGKSTWVQSEFKNALYLDLLAPDIFRTLTSRPERLEELVHGNPDKKIIIIDEIQKAPAVLSVVHRLIEEKHGYQFILTGSSARKIKRSGVDLLAGRALHRTFHPFIAAELKDRFKLEEALKIGMLPLIFHSPSPEETLSAYIALYLREEVQMEGLVRNLGNFSRFLEILSFSHGASLNTSHVSRECEIERKVVEGYISIVEDLLLGYKIPVFTKRAKRAMTHHPKFYFFDAGVFRTLRPKGPLDRPEEIDGAALEGLVAQHLRAWVAYQTEDHQLYFWRTRSGSEIDFVLYGPKGLWAFEVKNSSKVRPEDLRGLKSFSEDYPEAKTFLLYRGKEKIKTQNILCLPCEEFLKNLSPREEIL
jgi:predicted AAA+ superfamily ATPase